MVKPNEQSTQTNKYIPSQQTNIRIQQIKSIVTKHKTNQNLQLSKQANQTNQDTDTSN